jgi:hypothetical protein
MCHQVSVASIRQRGPILTPSCSPVEAGGDLFLG